VRSEQPEKALLLFLFERGYAGLRFCFREPAGV
jgi:hypothetical protein